ncbi:MAG: hypothetical protein JWM46_567 [Candidatus Kaiserbacteria bacterium]|nr:hypothetical protein [Candidatus Kaiserbacteria bacterium]
MPLAVVECEYMEKMPQKESGADRNRRLGQMGANADTQLNEIYAKKYEEAAALARDRMLQLEGKLNEVTDEESRQSILRQIEEERSHIEEMNSEAGHRRTDNKES